MNQQTTSELFDEIMAKVNDPNHIIPKTAFAVHANDQDDHCTMLFIENLTTIEYGDAHRMYLQTVKDLVPKDINGKHMLTWTNRKPWGANSVLLYGPLDDFHKKLHERMVNCFGSERVSWIDTHVDVKGDYNKELYPLFNMGHVIIM